MSEVETIRRLRLENKSVLQVSVESGIDRRRVARLVRSRGLALPLKDCRLCGERFQADRPAAQFCCREHQEKASKIKDAYGLEPEAYFEMWRSQEGVCANPGCATPLPLIGRHVHVDHDHQAGHVRRLMCTSCNVAYGMALECPHRLLGLVTLAYLDRSSNGR